jgi:HlyD family secretion protein
VAEVWVRVGDRVRAGDVLMVLDPVSAPQNVIMAQADLISAQKALDELLNPTELALAQARQAVVNAQDHLAQAQKNLKYAENPASQGLHDAVRDAELALETARANQQLANVSQDVQDYNGNVWITDWYFQRAQDAQAKLDANSGSLELQEAARKAWSDYQARADQQAARQLRIQTDQANKDHAVLKAQQAYDTAVANLNAALQGPNADRLAVAQASVAVAEAALDDAQAKLDRLLNGADPADIAAAEARIQAAQAVVDTLMIKAPFDGEVLVINYQPGDAASSSQAAVVLADRSRLHVDVSVDETDVSAIQAGDPVTVTLDAVPGLALRGVVSQVNPLGQIVQGLVRFTVRVDLEQSDARVLLGMTASAVVVTDVRPGALAVPLDAVQLDARGEFVNRVRADGAFERVDIVSGQLQDDLVIVTGDLRAGDRVQLVEPVPTTNVSPFGPG